MKSMNCWQLRVCGKGLLLPTLLLIAMHGIRGKEAIDYIDPFIGTGHDGKDFPGASAPFGMTKVSPDTTTAGGGQLFLR